MSVLARLLPLSLIGAVGLSNICLRKSQSITVFILVYLISSILACFYHVLIYPRFVSPLRNLPSPEIGRHWIFGHFLETTRRSPGIMQKKWMKDIPNSGLICYRGLFNRDIITPTTPAVVKEILFTKCYDWEKPTYLLGDLLDILGLGVFAAEGSEHKRQRKIINVAFQHRHIRQLVPIFWTKADQLARIFSGKAQNSEATIDVMDWASKITLNVIGAAGFGYDFHAMDEDRPQDDLSSAYDYALQEPRSPYFLMLQVFLPRWLLRLLPSRKTQAIDECRSLVRKVGRKLIAKRKQEDMELQAFGRDDDAKRGIDILAVIIRDQQLTDEEMCDQIMTFMLAGHETTAVSFTWALYALAKNKEIQDKLRQEVCQTLKSMNDCSLDCETLESMVYLRSFLNEIFRVYPATPVIPRIAAKNTTVQLPAGPVIIPKGTLMISSILGINTSTEIWGEDAEVFDPERWNQKYPRSQNELLTFWSGPRTCIAKQFATLELKVLLVAMVARFEFVIEDAEKIIEVTKHLPTIRPVDGMPLKVKVLPSW